MGRFNERDDSVVRRTWPYAFCNICDHLALDPEAVRSRADRWQMRRLAAADTQGSRFAFTRIMVGRRAPPVGTGGNGVVRAE